MGKKEKEPDKRYVSIFDKEIDTESWTYFKTEPSEFHDELGNKKACWMCNGSKIDPRNNRKCGVCDGKGWTR
jgi:DnaJ-class molecular chaperone